MVTNPSLGIPAYGSPVYTVDPYMNGLYDNNNFYSGNYPVNPMLTYGEQYPSMNYGQADALMYQNGQYLDPYSNQYYPEQNPSPIISELARQYVTDIYDQQYQSQLLQSYGQFYQDPYAINSYF